MSSSRLDVLLLADRIPNTAANVDRHVDALAAGSRHRVLVSPMLGDLPAGLDPARFDAIVVHWSLASDLDRKVRPEARRRLRAAPAAKAVFIQDEHRHVHRNIAAFRELGIEVLFTCVPEEEVAKVYPEAELPGVERVSVLTGYVDPALVARTVPAFADRPIDVGYRARRLPAHNGQLGYDKYAIGRRFAEDAPRHGLVVDISHRQEDRFHGEDWVRFLTRCRATLGVESGASVFDFDGSVAAAVAADLAADPRLGFGELQRRHFAHLEGRVRVNQISPRVFEAAALRTLLILYEGDYSGRLAPWKHYVPLRRDHANMAEVAAVLRDSGAAQEIIDRAYEDVAQDPRNGPGALAAQFDAALDRAAGGGRRAGPPYAAADVEALAARDLRLRSRLLRRRARHLVRPMVFGKVLGRLDPDRRDRIEAEARRWASRVAGIAAGRRR